jgi:branched-chain amino acid aminotransferase
MGDAVFDTTRTFDSRIFKLKEHLDRFYRSLKYMRIDPGISQDELAEQTRVVVERNLPLLGENEDYWIFQRVTRGARVGGVQTPIVLIHCDPLPLAERAHYYRDGMHVVTPSIRRTPPEAMSPRAKVNNYINMTLASLEVKAQNPDAWPILLDINGNLCEGSGSNIFVVRDGVVMTPQDRYVLPGISRQTTIELAHELDIEVKQADLDLFDAYNADEVFITSTSLCICPASKINGVEIGDGATPGPVTQRLTEAYSGLVDMDIVGQYLAHLS